MESYLVNYITMLCVLLHSLGCLAIAEIAQHWNNYEKDYWKVLVTTRRPVILKIVSKTPIIWFRNHTDEVNDDDYPEQTNDKTIILVVLLITIALVITVKRQTDSERIPDARQRPAQSISEESNILNVLSNTEQSFVEQDRGITNTQELVNPLFDHPPDYATVVISDLSNTGVRYAKPKADETPPPMYQDQFKLTRI
ncbi:uncharacterized protein LOC118194032 isoform X2 [Stegodyphus dumicola]|uniref:uncharacterized protein LOC118194032 isoform X2 n=1 Tax=Stegodyphus dumicola TaxID=202533 RepID=UPI0015AE4B64|nr:uncharacterized protein LOC118194032 isoform X2 [Stegodyphus dumicola]